MGLFSTLKKTYIRPRCHYCGIKMQKGVVPKWTKSLRGGWMKVCPSCFRNIPRSTRYKKTNIDFALANKANQRRMAQRRWI